MAAKTEATKAELPDKLYFKIGEVAKLVGVKPYVLRYWETEFPSIRPGKTESKHRLYRRRDVETLIEIRRLLHDERYTIEGAKRRLRGGRGREAERPDAAEAPEAAHGSEAAEAAERPEAAEVVELTERAEPEAAPGQADSGSGDQMDLPIADGNYRDALRDVQRELRALRDLLA